MAQINIPDSGIWSSIAVALNSMFTELFALTRLSNRVVVTEASDLSGALDSTKQYFIDGVVDMGSQTILVPAGGLSLSGYNFDVSKLTSSVSGYTMFTSPAGGSGNVIGMDYAIEVTGSGSQVYDLTDATGFNAFEFSRINYNDCTSLGEISGYRQGLETGTGRFGGKPQLTLTGTWVGGYFIDTSIVRSLVDGAYSLFAAGTAFSMNSRFRSNMNIDLPASASFLDFAPANFPNSSTLQLDGCLLSRNGSFNSLDATIIPNMVNSDLASSWNANVGIRNTFLGGRQTASAESATVIAATSTFYALNATWTPSGLSHFDSPGNGQLRHIGASPIEFKIQADFTIEGTTGNELAVRIKKWDDSAGSFIDFQPMIRPVNALVGGRDVAFITVIRNIALDTNDYFLFEVANNSTSDNVTLELDSDFLIEER